MIRVDNISDDSHQISNISLADGTTLTLELRYLPAVQRWMLNVTHVTFILNGINVCVHPNLLRQWENIITFGIAVVTSDGADPVFIDDFFNGRAVIYILDNDEKKDVEEIIYLNT